VLPVAKQGVVYFGLGALISTYIAVDAVRRHDDLVLLGAAIAAALFIHLVWRVILLDRRNRRS